MSEFAAFMLSHSTLVKNAHTLLLSISLYSSTNALKQSRFKGPQQSIQKIVLLPQGLCSRE